MSARNGYLTTILAFNKKAGVMNSRFRFFIVISYSLIYRFENHYRFIDVAAVGANSKRYRFGSRVVQTAQ